MGTMGTKIYKEVIFVEKHRRGHPSIGDSGLFVEIIGTGERFDSYTECAEYLDCDRGFIRKCCSNKYPSHKYCRGYKVRVVCDELDNDTLSILGYKID
jgi:hypothetical protein